MDIKRSQRSNLYKDILNCLKKGEFSISEISKDTGMNWETAERNLNVLKEIGLVEEKKEENRRVFFIKDKTPLEEEKDTLLGLPLTKQQRENTFSLFKVIRDEWVKQTDRPLNKTFMQKIAVKVIKEANITSIPYGWYLFGQMTLVQCNPLSELPAEVNGFGYNYQDNVKKVVSEYLEYPNTNALMNAQYSEEHNALYLAKLGFVNAISNPITDKDVVMLKRKLLDIRFSLIKDGENEQIVELVDAFISIVGFLLGNLKPNELEEIKPNVMESFRSLWNCIATYDLYKDVVDKEFYEKGLAYKYYLLRINPLIDICEGDLCFIKEFMPKLNQEDDPSLRFKGIISK